MDRIYIVGYMGAGKTTAARRVAQRLGWEVADTDALFEEKYRVAVDDFFQKYDEPLFRLLESEILKQTEHLDHVVVATGGGSACFYGNMEWMNRHGLTVFMRISPEAAVDRILRSKHKRPPARGKTEAQLSAFVHEHYAQRLPFYEQAQITVKAEDFDLEQLMEKLALFT